MFVLRSTLQRSVEWRCVALHWTLFVDRVLSFSLCPSCVLCSFLQSVEVVMIYVYEALALVIASVILGTGIGQSDAQIDREPAPVIQRAYEMCME
jgi:hypothetical protein